MPENRTKSRFPFGDYDRVIDTLQGKLPGPHLVFFAGIHGNEPLGVLALKNVIQKIRSEKSLLRGKITAIAGNVRALRQGHRYNQLDLNRLWTKKNIDALSEKQFFPQNEDEEELIELFTLVQTILLNQSEPLYFFDLHTTSSMSIPFIPVNDSLLNRAFARKYPLPLILGIEEYIQGPILSYINELGYVSFGFEAGQHTDPMSLKNHEIFIQLSLSFAGACTPEAMNLSQHLTFWKMNYGEHQNFYEIFFRFGIEPGAQFQMIPGFASFQPVHKGKKLADYNGKPIHSPRNARLFMPRYQPQGEDGFFLIRRTPRLFLQVSAFLRKQKLDRLITWLPGVNWASDERDSLLVDLRIARLLTRPILHLFGYRSSQRDQNHLRIWNRESKSRYKDYQNEPWYIR